MLIALFISNNTFIRTFMCTYICTYVLQLSGNSNDEIELCSRRRKTDEPKYPTRDQETRDEEESRRLITNLHMEKKVYRPVASIVESKETETIRQIYIV